VKPGIQGRLAESVQLRQKRSGQSAGMAFSAGTGARIDYLRMLLGHSLVAQQIHRSRDGGHRCFDGLLVVGCRRHAAEAGEVDAV
jgi:hypothetical protein